MLLTVLSVVWTPTSQRRYDACLSSRDRLPDDAPFCRVEDALKWAEGLLLGAFAAEMSVKVGTSRLCHVVHLVVLLTVG